MDQYSLLADKIGVQFIDGEVVDRHVLGLAVDAAQHVSLAASAHQRVAHAQALDAHPLPAHVERVVEGGAQGLARGRVQHVHRVALVAEQVRDRPQGRLAGALVVGPHRVADLHLLN